jgi:hypothetical protein
VKNKVEKRCINRKNKNSSVKFVNIIALNYYRIYGIFEHSEYDVYMCCGLDWSKINFQLKEKR